MEDERGALHRGLSRRELCFRVSCPLPVRRFCAAEGETCRQALASLRSVAGRRYEESLFHGLPDSASVRTRTVSKANRTTGSSMVWSTTGITRPKDKGRRNMAPGQSSGGRSARYESRLCDARAPISPGWGRESKRRPARWFSEAIAGERVARRRRPDPKGARFLIAGVSLVGVRTGVRRRFKS